MHSSVRSTSPRLVNIGSLSNGTVHIDQEISVVRSRADDRKNKANYPNMASISNGHIRARTSDGPISAMSSAPQLNRWNSESRMSDRSSRRRVSQGHMSQLDSNRESMKALADFLMTRDPPKDNFMSIPESDISSLHSMKKSAFKIFGRRKTRQSKAPRIIQLPDSAVAAKTREGVRHIAISIPIEHDHLESAKPQHLAPPVTNSQPKRSSERHERAAVTVLKPVVEVRESNSANLQHEEEVRRARAESVATPPAIVLGPEATKTLENYYSQLSQQQKRSKVENATKGEPSRRSYIAVSPHDLVRQDSMRSDPRHSGGTQYSTATLTSLPGHSRGTSSVSTAPSATLISSLKLDLPPRQSSMSRIPASLEAELAQASKMVNDRAGRQDLPLTTVISGRSARDSLTSGTTSSVSPMVLGTAETAQSYDGSHVDLQTISRGHIPQPSGAAPNRKLPDLPEDAGHPMSRPNTAPVLRQDKAVSVDNTTKRPYSARDSTAEEAILVTRQSRQERVKARKQRDMKALRDKASTRSLDPGAESVQSDSGNSNSSLTPIPHTPLTAPAKNPKRSLPGGTSQSHDLRKQALNNPITTSPIMLVASLAPYTGIVLASDLPLPRMGSGLRKVNTSSASNMVHSPNKTHTPPRSFTSSFGSDSETIPNPNSHHRTRSQRSVVQRTSASRSVSRKRREGRRGSASTLESRRSERRMKRNASAREQELDRRLGRIERDNEVLLRTLGGVARSFAELNRLLPKGAQLGGLGSPLGSPLGFGQGRGLLVETDREEEVRNIEPVMRELQRAAPEVSGEDFRGIGFPSSSEP